MSTYLGLNKVNIIGRNSSNEFILKNLCRHSRTSTIKLSYCIGEGDWYCCDNVGEFQNFKICMDCGMVYVSPTNNPGESISCGECDDPEDWDGYLNIWLPATTFVGLINRQEYKNIYH